MALRPLSKTPALPLPVGRASRLACAFFALLLAAGASFAQMPRLPSLSGKGDAKVQEAKPAPAESPEQAIAEIRRKLQEIGSDPPPAPANIPAPEVDSARQAHSSLRYIYERQIRAYGELETARQDRAKAEASERDWTGFAEQPPYPILMVDGLREAAGAARARISSLEAGTLHLGTELARNREDLKRAQAAQRAASDAYDTAKDDAGKATAAWRRDAAALEARRIAGWAYLSQVMQDERTEELAARRAELRLLERQIAVAAPHVRFTEQDVAKAREQSANGVAALTSKMQSVTATSVARERERDAAKRELSRLEATAGAGADQIAMAKARLRAANAWLDAQRTEVELLRGLIVVTQEFSKLWATRLTAATSPDADARREALARLSDGATVLERWYAFTQNPLSEARATLADAEARATRTTESEAATNKYDRDAVAAAVQTVAVIEGARDQFVRITSTLHNWVAQFREQESRRSLATRAADAWSTVREFSRGVWNFELFAIEDTAVLDGHEVTTSHGITVGKSVGAAALFLGGYGLAALLTRRLARLLVSRGVDERLVGTLRRWTLAVVGVVLILFTLNIARIPLTVFAFLGGTLAIAVGFGTQTIFKNLISGMILLLERSVQIGDLVEVEGISGTVTAVDLRSSTIKGFDGTDTIVPNSVLLENKFTNWTRNDRRVRRIVKVGIAYGSPVRKAADILEDCAKRHGLILDDPAPYAIFEDFGNDSLVLALYVWFEFAPNASLLVVLSDLRFMIERQFREAGIEIAFPQRDVHLDTKGPLRVELVRGGEPEPK
jgi:small-conductance mechanosensitive channel